MHQHEITDVLMACNEGDAGAIDAVVELVYEQLKKLAHSKIGDYLLENGEARFVIQDVGQRELYSVGQFGGILIDAELVGNEG